MTVRASRESQTSTPFHKSPNLQKLSVVMQRANQYAQAAIEAAEKSAGIKPKRKLFISGISEHRKAIPNYIARSGIFAPINKRYRVMHDETVFLQGEHILIKGSGKQLSEDHADIFMHAIFLQTTVEIGYHPVINRAEFLRAMGRHTGGSAYDWLHQGVKDLSRFTLCIEARRKDGQVKYSFGNHPSTRVLPMLGGFDYNEHTGNYILYVDERWSELFSNREYALVDWEKRLLLRHDLSKSLQRLIGTSSDVRQRFSLETLKERGQYQGRMRKFRESLKRSLAELEAHGIIAEPVIEKSHNGVEIARWFKR